MADSDDEYDRKRRDKFRGERSAGDSYRAERRDERRRDDWPPERNSFRGRVRPDYREYRGGRDRYSPGRELPPPKRMRPDWGDERRYVGAHDAYGMYGWGHEHYAMHGPHSFPPSHPPPPAHRENQNSASDMQTQPPMLTLKQFLDTQDDSISESEVLSKYSEYKLEFKRQQLNEFFVAHKDEEWFKNKYHPEEASKRKDEQLSFLKKRVEVFSNLLDQGSITKVSVDTNQTEQLLRLLDTVVIKLEGGTDDDLKALDEKPLEYIKPLEPTIKLNITKPDKDDDDVIITDVKHSSSGNNKTIAVVDDDEENWDDTPKATKVAKNDDDEENWDSFEEKKPKQPDPDEGSENWESFEDKKPKKEEDEEWDSFEDKKVEKDNQSDGEGNWESDGDSNTKRNKSDKRKRSDSESSESSVNFDERREKVEEQPKDVDEENSQKGDSSSEQIQTQNKLDENKIESKSLETDDTNENEESSKMEVIDVNDDENPKDATTDPETIDLEKEKDPEIIAPRHLHRTSSIFLRNLAPTITKDEIEAVCRKYDGFLRVAIADPLVERRWFRRGWVTFKRDVNIKEICWNLNNIRLRDCEMGAIVNRDLSRRVRPVNGITAHKVIVRSDIKLCAKIALNLDDKFNLWVEQLISEYENVNNGESKTKSGENNTSGVRKRNENFGFNSKNPVLQNITDYLIEEASAEEDELLGLTVETKEPDGEQLERDPQLISVLDKLILYLRIVHSVDFYNHCEYPYEDEMPNRCGIIHARGPPPQNKVTNADIQDYVKNFESKMQSFLAKSTPIDEGELKNLGCKDPEDEVEKFIQANTQELAKDKWLCPLSGKKFKGPEFIRKHIFNKHGEKVDEVRKEVEYFNNYLKDPKRPQLPEHPGNTKRQPSDPAPPGMYRQGYPAPGGYAPPYPTYAPPIISTPRPRGFGGRRELPLEHQRRIIGYHDLDAPPNFDLFD